MSSGGQRREPTERETLENDVRLARGRYAHHRAEMETAERQMNAAENKLMAFAAAEHEKEPCDCADRAPHGEYWVCPKCDAEWPAEEDEKSSGFEPRLRSDR